MVRLRQQLSKLACTANRGREDATDFYQRAPCASRIMSCVITQATWPIERRTEALVPMLRTTSSPQHTSWTQSFGPKVAFNYLLLTYRSRKTFWTISKTRGKLPNSGFEKHHHGFQYYPLSISPVTYCNPCMRFPQMWFFYSHA